jgi:hypothetical protein
VGFSFIMKVANLIFLILLSGRLTAQVDQQLLAFEKQIEQAVVSSNLEFLGKAYASDFRFKHGTGLVDSKESWIKSVAKNKGSYLSRNVDYAEVEIHGEIGITNGAITVTKKDSSYTIQYVRVYRKKGDSWELFMHRTVHEVDN